MTADTITAIVNLALSTRRPADRNLDVANRARAIAEAVFAGDPEAAELVTLVEEAAWLAQGH